MSMNRVLGLGGVVIALLIADWRPLRAQNFFYGQVITVAFNFCPTGFAPLNGQTLSIASNSALFSLLGTNYGGNGTNNFALPNSKPLFTSSGVPLLQCIALNGIFPTRP